jgi:hypothetical protein
MGVTKVLLTAVSSVVLGACTEPTFRGSTDTVPTISGNIPMLAPDGKTIYYVQVVCTTVVRYSGSRTEVGTPTLSVPSVGVSLGGGSVDIQKTTLQQADTILQALDLAQFNACRDAVLRPGNTDSALLYGTMTTVLSAYATDLRQAKSDSQVQAANQKASTALDQVKTGGATTAPPSKTVETTPNTDPDASDKATDGASAATQ